MNNRLAPTHCLVLLGSLVLSLVAPACVNTGVSGPAVTPVAVITTPQNGSRFPAGDPVVIQFSAADVKGVSQIELLINGQPIRVEKVEPPVNSYVANHVWTPDSTGSHAIELRAFNVDGDASNPVKIVVTISEPLISETTPTLIAPVIGDTPTSIPAADTPIAPAEPAPTSAAPPPPAGSGGPTVTAMVGLNVRSGPGTGYPVIGRLVEGQTVPIIGRNPQGTWWQIAFPGSSGDRGWVSGSAQFSTANNAEGVSIVEVPPLPTPVPEPTNTPTPLKPTIHSFTADRYNIAVDEEVVLRWDLSNAREAYLRYDGKEEGVVAPGEKRISLDEDTVFTLIARNDAGETTAQVTIKVGGSQATPVSIYRDGKTRIVPNQTIDFDQGVIQQGSGNSGADFYWDGGQRRFVPQSGSSGALLGRAFDDISFEDCRSANYGQPIPEINPASRITGCYETNEGRYGKYWVSEWDLSGNLTIVWQTWDY